METALSVFLTLLSFSLGIFGIISLIDKQDRQRYWKRTETSDKAKFEVIVEMESPFVLFKEDKIAALALSSKLDGEVYLSPYFAEGGALSNTLAPFIRRFFLTKQEDFPIFAKAMKTIPGVLGIKKGGGPWEKTKEEKEAEEAENKRIAEEKRKQAEKSWKERERQFSEWKKQEQERQENDEANFGPPTILSKLDSQKFQEFVSAIGKCQAEGSALYFNLLDPLGSKSIRYKRIIEEISSGEEAVRFLEKVMNKEFRLPCKEETPFFKIPFAVEYRQKQGKRFVHLHVKATGKTNFSVAAFDLYIREL